MEEEVYNDELENEYFEGEEEEFFDHLEEELLLEKEKETFDDIIDETENSYNLIENNEVIQIQINKLIELFYYNNTYIPFGKIIEAIKEGEFRKFMEETNKTELIKKI